MTAREDIPIGTKFIPVGDRQQRVRTVVDVHKTYNSAGKLMKTRYVATHEFAGQTITEHDILHTTIARGFIRA